MNAHWQPTIVPQQRCVKCNGVYDMAASFSKNRDSRLRAHYPGFRATCIGCEQDKRDQNKEADPFIAKARGTIQRHAQRYHMTTPEFVKTYGWDFPRVAHLLRHAFDNTCAYCRRPYKTMRNGPSEVTMDIIDPKRDPFLETNTQPCCSTCNTEKRDLSPEMWSRRLRFWREWEDNKKRSETKVQLEFTLTCCQAAQRATA